MPSHQETADWMHSKTDTTRNSVAGESKHTKEYDLSEIIQKFHSRANLSTSYWSGHIAGDIIPPCSLSQGMTCNDENRCLVISPNACEPLPALTMGTRKVRTSVQPWLLHVCVWMALETLQAKAINEMALNCCLKTDKEIAQRDFL